jgi:PAS domain-containing protein
MNLRVAYVSASRVRWVVLLLTLSLGAFAARPGAQAPPPAPAGGIETLQVRPNVYMLSGAGANVVAHVGWMGVVLVEPGRKTYVNPRAEQIFGRPPPSDSGEKPYSSSVLFPDGRPVPRERRVSRRVIERGETVIAEEYLIERPDGELIKIPFSAITEIIDHNR